MECNVGGTIQNHLNPFLGFVLEQNGIFWNETIVFNGIQWNGTEQN